MASFYIVGAELNHQKRKVFGPKNCLLTERETKKGETYKPFENNKKVYRRHHDDGLAVSIYSSCKKSRAHSV